MLLTNCQVAALAPLTDIHLQSALGDLQYDYYICPPWSSYRLLVVSKACVNSPNITNPVSTTHRPLRSPLIITKLKRHACRCFLRSLTTQSSIIDHRLQKNHESQSNGAPETIKSCCNDPYRSVQNLPYPCISLALSNNGHRSQISSFRICPGLGAIDLSPLPRQQMFGMTMWQSKIVTIRVTVTVSSLNYVWLSMVQRTGIGLHLYQSFRLLLVRVTHSKAQAS